jgi:hypothetical protein
VHINVFGKEDLSYLLNDGDILQKLKAYSKKGVYGLADIIKEVHCNKDRPENNNIIKPHEYGNGVYIMGDDNEWEYREFEDVREPLVDTVNTYVEKYNDVRKRAAVKLSERREKALIKKLAYQLLTLSGDLPLDLEDELELDDDHIKNTTEDPDVQRNTTRKFDKATMSKLHEYTSSNYKKEAGKYVKNEY